MEDELSASSKTIDNDAHRVWEKKMEVWEKTSVKQIEKICPKFTYKTRLEADTQHPPCANMIALKDDFGYGGIFCAVKANDQDKQKCFGEIRQLELLNNKNKNLNLPTYYTTKQRDKLNESFQKIDLKNFKRNFGDTFTSFMDGLALPDKRGTKDTVVFEKLIISHDK